VIRRALQQKLGLLLRVLTIEITFRRRYPGSRCRLSVQSKELR
jgi:hypothetical protein